MTASKKELRDKLQQPFDSSNWKTILMDVFPNRLSLFKKPVEVAYSDEYIESFQQTGNVRLEDGKTLALFEVKVHYRVNLLKNRVRLRNTIAKPIDEGQTNGVLCVFSSNDQSYRFSFVAKETILTDDGAIITQETDARRFTYVLGPRETCNTAAERFYNLSQNSSASGLEDILEAFSVDSLNKLFFDRYKEFYQRFVLYLKQKEECLKIFKIKVTEGHEDFEDECKPIRDFVKKLLGRITFIYFLQKKGWMGCPKNDFNWGAGDPDFLRNLFRNTSNQDEFFPKILYKLFYDCLNKPNRPVDIFKTTDSRVPFLNGTLFEKSEFDEANLRFPSSLFEELFNFLSSYNFTIDENDPTEREVGIDAEMLGHIFENLLEDNKESGAYYTPKHAVQYMCKNAIFNYLKAKLNNHNQLFDLVFHHETGDLESCENWICQKKATILQLLDDLKVCDPAIGSGAFPIGILQELYWLKISLSDGSFHLDNLAQIKKNIIQNSIYGVDIETGAVEVARLRFWLAIILEEEAPSPLPNLDYKIMQGDSLKESYGGVDLSGLGVSGNLHSNHQQTELDILDDSKGENKKSHERIYQLTRKYFTESIPEKKLLLHNKIDKLILNHIDKNISFKENDLKNRIKITSDDISLKKRNLDGKGNFSREEKKLGSLEIALSKLEDYRIDLNKFSAKQERPYFLWHLMFQDIFDEGGFDIVIQNPPFIRQESLKNLKESLQEDFSCYNAKADISTYFYELANKLLKKEGVASILATNSWLDVDYGKSLQSFLLENVHIKEIVEFSGNRLFEASIRTVITWFIKKETSDEDITKFVILEAKNGSIPKVRREIMKSRKELFMSLQTRNKKIVSGKWGGKYFRAPDIYWKIIDASKGKLIPLREVADIRFGIKSGVDKFFFVKFLSEENGITSFVDGDGDIHKIESRFTQSLLLRSSTDLKKPILSVKDIPWRLISFTEGMDLPSLAKKYVCFGEQKKYHLIKSVQSRQSWYCCPNQEPTNIAVSKRYDIRFRTVILPESNDVKIGQAIYPIYPLKKEYTKAIQFSLFSTFNYLSREICGRANFGEGVMELSTEEIGDLLVLSPNYFSKDQIPEPSETENFNSVYELLLCPIQLERDIFFLKLLGIDGDLVKIAKDLQVGLANITFQRRSVAKNSAEGKTSFNEWIKNFIT